MLNHAFCLLLSLLSYVTHLRFCRMIFWVCEYKSCDGSGPIMAQESESKKSQTERTGCLVKSNILQLFTWVFTIVILSPPQIILQLSNCLFFHRKPIHPPASSHLKVESLERTELVQKERKKAVFGGSRTVS